MMRLDEVAESAIRYLNSLFIEAEYEIYKDITGKRDQLLEMPNAHRYNGDEYVLASNSYTYDLLVVRFLGREAKLPFLKTSTSDTFYNSFDFSGEKIKFERKLHEIAFKAAELESAKRVNRFFERLQK